MTVEIKTGDCRDILKSMPDASVNCVVTSPPYFGLRDYGHDSQIGLEPTPAEFVASMVDVFREVRRVLRDDGTLWLNLGDSYAGSWGAQGRSGQMSDRSIISAQQVAAAAKKASRTGSIPTGSGLKPKDLIGIPWRVAFALQDDGWYLRQDIVWSKPNPMPESVTDRCTKAHEYLFLLSKSQRYYYDAEAIAEQVSEASIARLSQDIDSQTGSARVPGKTNGTMKAVGRPQTKRASEIAREKGLTPAHIEAIRAVGIADTGKALVTTNGAGKNTDAIKQLAAEAKVALGGYYREFLMGGTRNKRSVWEVATQPFKEAHFATFPPKLVEPCILAGCPIGGVVLDPFGGAGTTGLVADRLQRNAILIELNPQYAEMARNRIFNDAPLLSGDAA